MEKQEKEKSGKGRTEERRYRVWPVVKRLVREIRKGDGSQTGRVAVYTLCAGLYPFLAILLPRLAIGILERDGSAAMKRLVPALGIYFLYTRSPRNCDRILLILNSSLCVKIWIVKGNRTCYNL